MIKKLVTSVILTALLVAAVEVPQGNEEPQPQRQQVNQVRKKSWTQGCLIGGMVIIFAGLGFGAGWTIDHSNHSTNQDVDIDIDCAPVVPLEPVHMIP